jgi:uncharacterized protein (TIGR00725 family)
MAKPVVGVMGASANDALSAADAARVKSLADALGAAIAQADCILVTGATTGLPDLVAKSFRSAWRFRAWRLARGESRDHVADYGLPDDGADVIVYTGFGYKGRNVVNVRSSDIVIVVGGATGTLNEFTIAYDEGKVVGVLEGSGGVADHLREIIEFCNKPTTGAVIFDGSRQAWFGAAWKHGRPA